MDNRTILIVDDDPEDIEIFTDAVMEIAPDIRCISAQNGNEGLHLIESSAEKPDFIFLDLHMPKLNGRQFISEVRKNRSYKRIKLFIYTTSGLEKDRLDIQISGADGFVVKPTSFSALCRIIADIIQVPFPPASQVA